MGSPVSYFEIVSPDAPAARAFYRELFDWSLEVDENGYAMVNTGAGEQAIIGGIAPAGPDNPAGVKVYMRVDDLAAHLEKAERLGGKTVLPPMELPSGFGHIAVFTDPDGNPVGLWVM